MGCQQSKIKDVSKPAATVLHVVPAKTIAAVSAPTPTQETIAPAITPPMLSPSTPADLSDSRQNSMLTRRGATRVTFVASREASPEASVPQATAPPASDATSIISGTDVDPSPARVPSRSKSSSLEGIEPDVFQISKATSLDKMYRRWTRKHKMIAARNAAILAAFVPSMSPILEASSNTAASPFEDYVDASALVEEEKQIETPFVVASPQLCDIEASPERLQHNSEMALLPFHQAENLWLDATSPARQRMASTSGQVQESATQLSRSPLRARSTNSAAIASSDPAPSPFSCSTSWSATLRSSYNAVSTPLQCMQVSFSSQLAASHNGGGSNENAFVDCTTPGAKAVGTALNCAPVHEFHQTHKKPRSKSRKHKKPAHEEFGNGPVAPRWDKGSRALMRTQVYLEMTEAFLASSGGDLRL